MPAEQRTPAPTASGIGKFQCPVCAARFPTMGGKRRHMRTHQEAPSAK